MLRLIIASLAILSLGSTADAGIFARRHRTAAAPRYAQQPQAAPQPVSYGPSAPTGHSSALDEVNALRAARWLPAYIQDDGLEQAAIATATFRAERLMFGHVTGGMGDFAFLPRGIHASATGCAAYPPSYGFMACAIYDRYTFAGAAWVLGRDGKRYCHLFVR